MNPVNTGLLAPEGCTVGRICCEWTFLLDASRFEDLQGLKPQESSKSVVAAKAATYKA
jgi:hypothetical protein